MKNNEGLKINDNSSQLASKGIKTTLIGIITSLTLSAIKIISGALGNS